MWAECKNDHPGLHPVQMVFGPSSLYECNSKTQTLGHMRSEGGGAREPGHSIPPKLLLLELLPSFLLLQTGKLAFFNQSKPILTPFWHRLERFRTQFWTHLSSIFEVLETTLEVMMMRMRMMMILIMMMMMMMMTMMM